MMMKNERKEKRKTENALPIDPYAIHWLDAVPNSTNVMPVRVRPEDVRSTIRNSPVIEKSRKGIQTYAT